LVKITKAIVERLSCESEGFSVLVDQAPRPDQSSGGEDRARAQCAQGGRCASSPADRCGEHELEEGDEPERRQQL
jgi:hypothetical protein